MGNESAVQYLVRKKFTN